MPEFAQVMNYPDKLFVFDFTGGYDPGFIRSKEWGVGRYNEKRPEMYIAPQYEEKRDIHVGIDIWTRAGSPVFSFDKGRIAYLRDNNQIGNYGPTLVIEYENKINIGTDMEEVEIDIDKGDGSRLFALYGHLSRETLERWSPGDAVQRGEQIATLGSEEVNGGWVPHLHFQLSIEDPGEADMPGVVSEEERERALQIYPDPRKVLGELY